MAESIVAVKDVHELIEEFVHSPRAYIDGSLIRMASYIVIEAEEESLELIKHKLVGALALLLLEIDAQQIEHSVNDVEHHLFIASAAVLAQALIDRLLELQTSLTKRGAVVA